MFTQPDHASWFHAGKQYINYPQAIDRELIQSTIMAPELIEELRRQKKQT
jgi:hypothetical protein